MRVGPASLRPKAASSVRRTVQVSIPLVNAPTTPVGAFFFHSHFAAFRACGQAELGDKRDQQRSVVLDFKVLPSGAAVMSNAGTNALERCLGQALSSVSFAASDSSATTHVVYPLHFAAAGSGLKDRGVPTPVARERCDCGG